MKKLPIDVSTFKTIIDYDYLYIDKTEHIYTIVTKSRYYFLSRPRRFGKSLLISTLKEVFLGNKELFKDLWIYKSDYTWESHPVIHLDFSVIAHETVPELKLSLSWTLMQIAEKYGINIAKAPTPQDKFSTLIEQLAKRNSVVILVDEYDKPLLDHIQDVKRAETQRNFLKTFYDVLKGMDEYLKAIFVTGVSKFSKTSIFSGINNLNDISLDKEAAQLLGYTQEEIDSYFPDYIAEVTQEQNVQAQEVLHIMRQWYNGYRFSDQEIKVYNPFSILYYLHKKRLANYWFASGTPSFLINLLKNQYQSLQDLHEVEMSTDSLGTFDLTNIPLVPLLFQAGYLTITDYNPTSRKFKLGYPNLEVEESLKKYIVAALSETNPVTVDTTLSKLITALHDNNIDAFCSHLQALFAHIPYTLHINKESYYHSLFQLILSLLPLESYSEVLTDKGRIDTVAITKTHIYIFELKFNTDAIKALEQIKEQKYYERYMFANKHIVLIGISFNQKQKKLALSWHIEYLSKPS